MFMAIACFILYQFWLIFCLLTIDFFECLILLVWFFRLFDWIFRVFDWSFDLFELPILIDRLFIDDWFSNVWYCSFDQFDCFSNVWYCSFDLFDWFFECSIEVLIIVRLIFRSFFRFFDCFLCFAERKSFPAYNRYAVAVNLLKERRKG